jgi:hypothetical protein
LENDWNLGKGLNGPTPFTVRPSPTSNRPKAVWAKAHQGKSPMRAWPRPTVPPHPTPGFDHVAVSAPPHVRPTSPCLIPYTTSRSKVCIPSPLLLSSSSARRTTALCCCRASHFACHWRHLSVLCSGQLCLILLSLEHCPASECHAAAPLLLSTCLTEFQSSVVSCHNIKQLPSAV